MLEDHGFVIDFIPPLEGFGCEFNTFRLSRTWAKRLNVGDEVQLLCNKERRIFAKAKVTEVCLGRLQAMLLLHAKYNHTQIGKPKREAPEALMGVMQKIYGPHIATPEKWASVIYLKRI